MNLLLLSLHVYISGNLQMVWGTWKNKEPNNVKKKQQPEQPAALLFNKLKYKIHVIYRPQKPT